MIIAETACGCLDNSCAKVTATSLECCMHDYCITWFKNSTNVCQQAFQHDSNIHVVTGSTSCTPAWLVLAKLHRSVEGSTLSRSRKTKAGSLGATYRLTHILYVSLLCSLFRSRRICPMYRWPDPLEKHSRAVCLQPGFTCAKRSAPMLRVPAVHAGQRYSPCVHTLI